MSTPLLLIFGLDGMLAFFLLAALMGLVMWRKLPHVLSFQPPLPPRTGGRAPSLSSPDDSWRGFGTLLGVICARSFAYYTLLGLVPLYFIVALETSDATANAALAAMLVFGALGTLVGGRLADRIGRRPVLVASLALQPPLLIGMTLVGTVPAIVLVGALGFVAISSFSVTVVMGQEYLPSRIGLASGFTLGAAIGIGGLAAPVFGLIGDHFSLETSIQTLAILPALGALLALTLPLAASRKIVESRREASATAGG